ncbi:MAG: hypothetical protein KKB20_29735 [Proteobacteria bacterium]|nr:hypothetical protein [Pseudomonadota bacterium]
MRANVQKTVQLGELVAAAFDEAARHSSDPREVSRLAATAVMRMLQRARKTSITSASLADAEAGGISRWRRPMIIHPFHNRILAKRLAEKDKTVGFFIPGDV